MSAPAGCTHTALHEGQTCEQYEAEMGAWQAANAGSSADLAWSPYAPTVAGYYWRVIWDGLAWTPPMLARVLEEDTAIWDGGPESKPRPLAAGDMMIAGPVHVPPAPPLPTPRS